MSQKSGTPKLSSERIVKDIRRATRVQYSAEEKIRVVLDGLRGEHSIGTLPGAKALPRACIYTWSKDFQEAGKRRLAGDTARAATSGEVKDLRREAKVPDRSSANLVELRYRQATTGQRPDQCELSALLYAVERGAVVGLLPTYALALAARLGNLSPRP